MAPVRVMFFFLRRGTSWLDASAYRVMAAAGSVLAARICLAKGARSEQLRPNPGEETGRSAGNYISHHDQGNPAQRLRDELRGPPVAGAVDPSARPHGRI